MQQSLKGQLLIASPKLKGDPNFYHTIVLLVQHDENGCLGLVLNRPLEITIQKAWKQLSAMPCAVSGHLHQGGPCEGVLMALHDNVEASDLEVMDGVHFSTSKNSIEELVSQGSKHVRLFVGSAGWSPGQLEREISTGAWLTTLASPDHIFGPQQGAWERLMREIGRRTLLQWMDPKLVPDDPSVN